MHNKNLITKLFNPRLFLEALKRLRVIGLATAILSVTVTALVPIAIWMIRAPRYEPMTMDTEVLCVPVGVMVFMAPLFFLTLFSFLQKRKESDFFHAIPYTRTCVYVSFCVAALTFVFAIQAACGLVAGMLWGFMPNLSFDLGGMIAYVLICMLASAMLSSFMMLALTVSGTQGSCGLLYLLFAGFVRVVLLIFMGCISTINILPYEEILFLQPNWFLPINVIWYFGNIESATVVMYSLSNILYSLVFTVGIYVLAGFFYHKRQSEMAGNPAPSVRTQTLFRVLFTLPLALVFPLCLITGSDDSTLLLILTVAILLVYFLYELITTKRAKNMLRAIPSLGFVLGACILFSLAFYGFRTVILYERIDAEDIKTVSVDSDLFGNGTYQSHLLDAYRIDEEEICGIIANRLEKSQEAERTNTRIDRYYRRTTVTIHLKGGRSIRRRVYLSSDETAKIVKTIRENGAVREILYTLPSLREITNVDLRVNYPNGGGFWDLDRSVVPDLMRVFRKEFATLTDKQKDSVMRNVMEDAGLAFPYVDDDLVLVLSGSVNGNYYYNRYVITEDLPLTRRYLLAAYAMGVTNRLDAGGDNRYGTAFSLFGELEKDLEKQHFPKLNVELQGFTVDGQGKGTYYDNTLGEEQLLQLVTLLRERDKIKTETDPDDLHAEDTFTSESWCVNLRVSTNSDSPYMYLDISCLVELTPDDWKAIEDILVDKTIEDILVDKTPA